MNKLNKRDELWRTVRAHGEKYGLSIHCDVRSGSWFQFSEANFAKKHRVVVHLPDGMITAMYSTRSSTGKIVSSVPPELDADQIAIFDEDLNRATLREKYVFSPEEKMHEKLVGELSFATVPEPNQLRKKMRKADAEQKDLVRHIEFCNLTAKPKHKIAFLVGDFWKTTKSKRPQPVKKKDIELSDSQVESLNELSSEEQDTQMSEIELEQLEDDDDRSCSLFRIDMAQEQKIHDALAKFSFPKLAEKLLQLLAENPSMTVEELVESGSSIFKTFALSGRAQAMLESLEKSK